jgi:hypothetical protein
MRMKVHGRWRGGAAHVLADDYAGTTDASAQPRQQPRQLDLPADLSPSGLTLPRWGDAPAPHQPRQNSRQRAGVYLGGPGCECRGRALRVRGHPTGIAAPNDCVCPDQGASSEKLISTLALPGVLLDDTGAPARAALGAPSS